MYTPVFLSGQSFGVSPRTQANTARAERMMIRMEDKAAFGRVSQALRRSLARLEALSTIRIEGKRPRLRSLLFLESFPEEEVLFAEARLDSFDPFGFDTEEERQTTLEVLHYLQTLEYIYRATEVPQPFTKRTLLDIHSLSLHGCLATNSDAHFRQKNYSLPDVMAASKVYDPPQPAAIPALIDDLCAFINDEIYAPITQSAIAHFQFESIKPFKTGLDKTGRLMCHAILRQRHLTNTIIAPIGLEPAIDTKSHARSLLPYNFGQTFSGENRMKLIDNWADFCAWSAEISVHVADVYLDALLNLKETWFEEFGKPNRGSAPEILLNLLLGCPILTVKQASKMTGKSISSINDAFLRLEKKNIVEVVDNTQRSRVFAAPAAIALFEELDAKIAPSSPVARDSFFETL